MEAKAALYDGQYHIDLEISDEIDFGSGKYLSPEDDGPGRILIAPDQPEFDRDVALMHEINEHIAWTREAKLTFVSHKALDYHACRFIMLVRNSPVLAKFLSKKGG